MLSSCYLHLLIRLLPSYLCKTYATSGVGVTRGSKPPTSHTLHSRPNAPVSLDFLPDLQPLCDCKIAGAFLTLPPILLTPTPLPPPPPPKKTKVFVFKLLYATQPRTGRIETIKCFRCSSRPIMSDVRVSAWRDSKTSQKRTLPFIVRRMFLAMGNWCFTR